MKMRASANLLILLLVIALALALSGIDPFSYILNNYVTLLFALLLGILVYFILRRK